MTGERLLTRRFFLAAAAEDQNQGNDDQPDPVIVKKIAQAVIHKNEVLPIIMIVRERIPSIALYEGGPSLVMIKVCRRLRRADPFRPRGMPLP